MSILTANKRCDNKRKTVVDRVYATIAINNGVSYGLQHASRTRFVRFSVIGLQNICGNVAGIRDLLLRGSLSDFATIHDNTAEPIEHPAILIIKTILNLIIGTAWKWLRRVDFCLTFHETLIFVVVSMKFMVRGVKSCYWIRCWLLELAKARWNEYSCEQMKCRKYRKFLRNYNAIITRTVPEYVSFLLKDRAAMEIRILLFLLYQYDRSHFFVNIFNFTTQTHDRRTVPKISITCFCKLIYRNKIT